MKQKNLPGELQNSQPCLAAACCAEQDGINSARDARENTVDLPGSVENAQICVGD